MYRYSLVAAAIGKPSEMVLEFAYNYRHSRCIAVTRVNDFATPIFGRVGRPLLGRVGFWSAVLVGHGLQQIDL